MSTTINGRRVRTVSEMTIEACFMALVLAPLLETMAIYEAGRQSAQATPPWEPF